eukprot:333530-Prorocentrum_lima.AAC.1
MILYYNLDADVTNGKPPRWTALPIKVDLPENTGPRRDDNGEAQPLEQDDEQMKELLQPNED